MCWSDPYVMKSFDVTYFRHWITSVTKRTSSKMTWHNNGECGIPLTTSSSKFSHCMELWAAKLSITCALSLPSSTWTVISPAWLEEVARRNEEVGCSTPVHFSDSPPTSNPPATSSWVHCSCTCCPRRLNETSIRNFKYRAMHNTAAFFCTINLHIKNLLQLHFANKNAPISIPETLCRDVNCITWFKW